MALVNMLTYILTFRSYHILQAPERESQGITWMAVPHLPTCHPGSEITFSGSHDVESLRTESTYGNTGRLVTKPSVGKTQVLLSPSRQKNGQVTISVPVSPSAHAPLFPCGISLHNSHQDNMKKKKRNRATEFSGRKIIQPCLTATWPPIVSKLLVSFVPSLSSLQSIRSTPQNGKRWSWCSMTPPSALQSILNASSSCRRRCLLMLVPRPKGPGPNGAYRQRDCEADISRCAVALAVFAVSGDL